jgi:hypothetical protein
MGSLDLQVWTHIGDLNRAIGAPVSDPARFKPVVPNAPDQRSALRFMERPKPRRNFKRTRLFLPHFAGAMLCLTTVASALGASLISITDYPSIHEAVAQNPGRRLYVPSGTYLLTNAVVLKADNTELEGPGILVQSNPAAAVIEVRAHRVRLRDLTLTRAPDQAETDRDAVLAADVEYFRVENFRIHDNHSSGASVRLQNCRFARIERCTIEDYKRVTVDDRTASPLYGYAFRCLDGNGVIVQGGRGNWILDNHIIEHRLLPTRKIKERHQLGDLTEGRQPTRFGELGRALEKTRFARNWHQGSAIVVTGPEETDFTRVAGNYLENCAQGIDLHCDRAIVTHNTVNGGMIGIKAMHGSRHLVISENILNRVDLWGIMLGPGAASHHAEPAAEGKAARPANTDGAVRLVGNVISDYGYGNEYWNWGGDGGVGSSFAIRIDRGQLASNPPIADVLVQGNIVSDPGKDGVLVDGKLTNPKPRYRHAFHIDLPKSGEPDEHYPRNIHVLDNLFEPGTDGVANVPLPYQK